MAVEVIQLARGGTLIKTPSGSLQVGAPPETIKDTMKILGDVPDTFVIPNRMFSAERGVSLADIEFPAYFNFFIKRRSIRVIGHRHQLETIMRVLREAVLGPDNIQLVREYPYGINRDLIPNLRAEMEYLRPPSLSGKRKAELSDMAVGIPWGPENRVPFGDMALERNKDCLRVVDGKNVLAEISLDVAFGDSPEKPLAPKPFEPPLFGVTVIGSGSGFDPGELTSGFIIWVNRRGILVDPPVDSTLWLRSMDINPRLIDDCILTHCHADHDSGILQKLLEEKKINLYTTETIMESFVRKYQSLTGLNYKTFMSLFHFHPISLQVPIRINGGEFRFFYTLHSIPTIGFEVYYQGKSFVNSSDSLYDPDTFKKLYERGDVNRYRMIELNNFPWHHSVIFHEAGIPPLHTPMQNLVDMPDAVKKRIFLMHVAQKSIPEGTGLSKAPDGREESIIIPVSAPASNEALEYLDVLNHIDLFSGLPIEKAREFLTLVKVEHFKQGDLIIRKHSVGDRFFMIVSGRARVERNGAIIKAYSNNDYTGETSMILNAPRNADVIAETDMKVLVMDKYDFLYFIRGSEIARQMKVIAQNREYD
ncbi:MAG: cAMP/cGMP-dependent 3',5'-cyclic-AMP/GMP phosphodiesterase, partial [Candidatus Riflebacteria bacterium]|nr:cAMP/cGMP-dependent 3',5'-cyclic-AMP/GMP phosphodiesterase [Candidatus Riflebacteria bacterium]